MICQMGQIVLGLAPGVLSGVIVDSVIVSEHPNTLPWMLNPLCDVDWLWSCKNKLGQLNIAVTMLVLCTLGSVMFMYGASTLKRIAGQRVLQTLRNRLFSSLVHQDVAFFDASKTGELTNRLSADVGLLNDLVTYEVANRIGSLLTVLACSAYLFLLSPLLFGVLIATFPVVFAVSKRYGEWFECLAKGTQDELAGGSAVAHEILTNIRTVKAFSCEKEACEKYGAKVDETYGIGVQMSHARGKYRASTAFLEGLANAGVLWVGAFQVLKGHMTPGDLTTFTIFAAQVT